MSTTSSPFRPVALLLIALAIGPHLTRAHVAAQDRPRTEITAQDTPPMSGGAVDAERGPWWTLWSTASPRDRLIVGMVTAHVYKPGETPDNNNAVGLVRDGVLAATFTTTHGPRGYVVAFERSWVEGTFGPLETMFGFRVGLVAGYDHRLFSLAETLPVLPYGQPMGLIRWGAVSMDLTYTWIVTSLTLGVTLW